MYVCTYNTWTLTSERYYDSATDEGLLPETSPYSHTWVFPSVRVALSVTFIPGFVMIMD